MKENKAIYVTKYKIREDQLNKEFQYNIKVTRDFHKRNDYDTKDAGVQCNYKKDNYFCTCKTMSALRRHNQVRYFSGQEKQIYAYHGSRSYTDIGVGSVKAFQRKKVKRIYLPETDDRGVGSSDLSSVYNRRTKSNREGSCYDHKKTSSKGVGGTSDATIVVLHEKLSPIVPTQSKSSSHTRIAAEGQKKNAEIGSNTYEKSIATISTQMDENKTKEDVQIGVTTVEVIVEHENKLSKQIFNDKMSKQISGKVEQKGRKISKRAQEAERVFSSDSLVQHIHNLEMPIEEKHSPMSIDPMENKLEREYRKMFCTNSKDSKDQRVEETRLEPELKSTSVLRRRFEQLRRGLAKKEDSKRNDNISNKDSSNGSEPSRRDVSIASDPPSLEARSYSNTKVYSAYPSSNRKVTSNSRPGFRRSVTGKKEWSREEEEESESQGVKGMFKLWSKKFNLDDEEVDHSPRASKETVPNPQKPPEPKLIIKDSESKKEGKKFFFFKKKSKDTTKQPFKQKKGVTAGRCEVGDGLMIKIGATTSNPRPPAEKERRASDQIPEEYEEMIRKAWLQQFLAQTIDSRHSVKIRWNNNAYATSSSTIFEIMENVYKETGVIFRSRSEITTGESSSYKPYTKQRVNFVQDVEAWMIPNVIPDNITAIPTIHSDESGDGNNNIQMRMSERKWIIDKSKAFSHKIEVVLHSRNVANMHQDPSSEYLTIDIPKGFFSDSSTDSGGPIHTSTEEVFKIVEYESPESNTRLRKIKTLEIGNNLNEFKVTVSIKHSGALESNILETDTKMPPVHSDVVIQGSNVYIPKRCNVIGVGIITQKDMNRLRKPILKVQDDYSEEDSDHSLHISNNQSKFAESYLQDYYRHWTPLGMEFFSWCVSDSHIHCCSDNSNTSVYNQGDGTKSCPNIYDDYQASITVISSCGTSCCSPCVVPLEEVSKPGLVSKFCNRFKAKSKSEPENTAIRVLPKDSVEVCRRRKLYAMSNKSNWSGADERPYSVPSIESRGAQNTLIEGPKTNNRCNRPNSSKKRVTLSDSEARTNPLALNNPPMGGILSFSNKKDTPKQATVIPEPTCNIPAARHPCQESMLPLQSPTQPPSLTYCGTKLSPKQSAKQSCKVMIKQNTPPSGSPPCGPPPPSCLSIGASPPISRSGYVQKTSSSPSKLPYQTSGKSICGSPCESGCQLASPPHSQHDKGKLPNPKKKKDCSVHGKPLPYQTSGKSICGSPCESRCQLASPPHSQHDKGKLPNSKKKKDCSVHGKPLPYQTSGKSICGSPCESGCQLASSPHSQYDKGELPKPKKKKDCSVHGKPLPYQTSGKSICGSPCESGCQLASPPHDKGELPKPKKKKDCSVPGKPTRGSPPVSRIRVGSPPRSRTDSPPRSRTDSPPRSRTDSPPRSRTGSPPRSRTGSPPRPRTGFPPRSTTSTPPRKRESPMLCSSSNSSDSFSSKKQTPTCIKKSPLCPPSPPENQKSRKKPPKCIPPLPNLPSGMTQPHSSPPPPPPCYPVPKPKRPSPSHSHSPSQKNSSSSSSLCNSSSAPCILSPKTSRKDAPLNLFKKTSSCSPPTPPSENIPKMPNKNAKPKKKPPRGSPISSLKCYLKKPKQNVKTKIKLPSSPPIPHVESFPKKPNKIPVTCPNSPKAAKSKNSLKQPPSSASEKTSQEFPWPMKNQNSNQPSDSSCISKFYIDNATKSKENITKKTSDGEEGGIKQKCCKCSSKPSIHGTPPISGIFLRTIRRKQFASKQSDTKQKDNKDAEDAKDCSTKDTKVNKDSVKVLKPGCFINKDKSDDSIVIKIKKETVSTEEIREGINIKIKDVDGNTLFERRNYTKNNEDTLQNKTNYSNYENITPKKRRPSVLNNLYKNSHVHIVSTSKLDPNVEQKEDSNIDIGEVKSEDSITNVVEINFKVKVFQGDKTTELNIETDDMLDKPKLDTQNQTEQQVCLLKDEAEQCADVANDKNDITIKIIIKNYKPKSKNKQCNEEFSRKISEKFHTVSTGYSDILPNQKADNVYSVHRATVNLTSSHEVSKSQIPNKDVTSEEYIERAPTDIVSTFPSATEKSGTEHSQSKVDLPSKVRSEDVDTQNLVNEKENTNKEKLLNYSSVTDTDEQDLENDIAYADDDVKIVNSVDLIKNALTKDEKKSLLKKVFAKAAKVKKIKNKENMKQIKDMLTLILTDSSDREVMAVPSNELVKEMTYASLKPNFFRDTDSLKNYYKESSAVSSNHDSHEQILNYPTKNVSRCSVVEDSEESSSYEEDKPETCICSNLAAKLNVCSTNAISCYCKNPPKTDEETFCDLRTEEDFLLLNYKTIEYIDVETQNSRYFCNSTNISVHSKAVSGSFRNCIEVRNVKNEKTVTIRNNLFKKDKMNSVTQRHPCELKKLNRNTMLGISDEDKVYLLNAKPVSMVRDYLKITKKEDSENLKRHKKTFAKCERPADILQSYETKKAVLEIYAESTKCNEGERIVAKLPKFVYHKESEIERNYEEYAEDIYGGVNSQLVLSIRR